MATRIVLIAAVFGVGALALWRPAPRPPIDSVAAGPAAVPPSIEAAHGLQHHRDSHGDSGDAELVVYVAGAVSKPGLYHLHPGERAAQAVALAGGLRSSADAAGVNLAQRANDGDEIYVPVLGERLAGHASERRGRRHLATPPPTGSVDVNRVDARGLAAVPGIGRAIAARIVELRAREGSFTSLDELLDVAGMTQTRLERARPYLREP
jgi:competence protein ComEA